MNLVNTKNIFGKWKWKFQDEGVDDIQTQLPKVKTCKNRFVFQDQPTEVSKLAKAEVLQWAWTQSLLMLIHDIWPNHVEFQHYSFQLKNRKSVIISSLLVVWEPSDVPHIKLPQTILLLSYNVPVCFLPQTQI